LGFGFEIGIWESGRAEYPAALLPVGTKISRRSLNVSPSEKSHFQDRFSGALPQKSMNIIRLRRVRERASERERIKQRHRGRKREWKREREQEMERGIE